MSIGFISIHVLVAKRTIFYHMVSASNQFFGRNHPSVILQFGAFNVNIHSRSAICTLSELSDILVVIRVTMGGIACHSWTLDDGIRMSASTTIRYGWFIRQRCHANANQERKHEEPGKQSFSHVEPFLSYCTGLPCFVSLHYHVWNCLSTNHQMVLCFSVVLVK